MKLQGNTKKPQAILFSLPNYRLLGVGLFVVILGYALMSGGGSDDPAVFSDSIFGFRQMVLAPLVVLSGYGLFLVAILKRKQL